MFLVGTTVLTMFIVMVIYRSFPGIIGDVFVNGIMQEKWEMFPLEFKKSLLEA